MAIFVPFLGYLGYKILIVLLVLFFSHFFVNLIDNDLIGISYIIALPFGGLFLYGFSKITPVLENWDSKAESYKPKPFTHKYGVNYPIPKPENFGIKKEEFEEYNKRFQFDYIKTVLSYGIFIFSLIYSIKTGLKGVSGQIVIGAGASAGIIVDYLFNAWNSKISQKHKYYFKVNEYQKSNKIYWKIQRENLKI